MKAYKVFEQRGLSRGWFWEGGTPNNPIQVCPIGAIYFAQTGSAAPPGMESGPDHCWDKLNTPGDPGAVKDMNMLQDYINRDYVKPRHTIRSWSDDTSLTKADVVAVMKQLNL